MEYDAIMKDNVKEKIEKWVKKIIQSKVLEIPLFWGVIINSLVVQNLGGLMDAHQRTRFGSLRLQMLLSIHCGNCVINMN